MQSPVRSGESLYQYMSRLFPNEVLPESEFIDAVQKTLHTGRFLLLIVGDGIREGVERMLGHLHEHPQRHFTFGLVEIGIYENPDVFGGRILLPSLVAKTTEVVRAVVRVETTGQAQVSVTTIEEKRDAPSGYQRCTLSEEEFFQKLPDETTHKLYDKLFKLAEEVGAEKTWRSSSVSLRLPAPDGSKRPLTLLVLTTSGELYTGHLLDKLEPVGLPKRIALDHATRIAGLFKNVRPKRSNPDFISRKLTAAEVSVQFDEFSDALKETVDEINSEA